ncbi:MAG: ABC transporter substrate-binding protein [Dehalococcoidia bacterium]|nr:ABC transporter substrate-binding protein [Dehalococcoidia bacterium]
MPRFLVIESPIRGGIVNTRGWVLAFLPATAFLLVATACGGGTPASTAAPTQSPTSAPTVAATSAPIAIATATARPTAVPTPTTAPTPTPGISGEARIALGTLEYNFLLTGGNQRVFGEPIYDYAIRAALDGTLDPNASFARSWTANSDSTTWTFKVRDDVVFHDGSKATAKDLKFTLEYYARPDVITSPGAELRRNIKSITTPDDSTAVVALNTPDIFFNISYVSSMGFNIVSFILPQQALTTKGLAEFNKSPVGSGPFKVDKITVGSHIDYQAVDKHWLSGVPRFKLLRLMQIPDETTRIALLRTGEAQVIEGSRAATAPLRRDGFAILEKEGSRVAQLVVPQQWQQGSPLSVREVRQAMRVAVDGQAIVDTFLKGLGKTSLGYPVVDWDQAYVAHPIPAYDPAKAKDLLKQGGYPSGFQLDMVSFPFPAIPEGPEIMEAIATYWEAVGIKVTRLPSDFAPFRDTWYSQKFTKPTVGGFIFVGKTPIASQLARGGLTVASVSRVTQNPELDRLAKQYAAATSAEAYVSSGKTLQKLVVDEAIYPVLFEAGEVYVANAKFSGTWKLGKAPGSLNYTDLVRRS